MVNSQELYLCYKFYFNISQLNLSTAAETLFFLHELCTQCCNVKCVFLLGMLKRSHTHTDTQRRLSSALYIPGTWQHWLNIACLGAQQQRDQGRLKQVYNPHEPHTPLVSRDRMSPHSLLTSARLFQYPSAGTVTRGVFRML